MVSVENKRTHSYESTFGNFSWGDHPGPLYSGGPCGGWSILHIMQQSPTNPTYLKGSTAPRGDVQELELTGVVVLRLPTASWSKMACSPSKEHHRPPGGGRVHQSSQPHHTHACIESFREGTRYTHARIYMCVSTHDGIRFTPPYPIQDPSLFHVFLFGRNTKFRDFLSSNNHVVYV